MLITGQKGRQIGHFMKHFGPDRPQLRSVVMRCETKTAHSGGTGGTRAGWTVFDHHTTRRCNAKSFCGMQIKVGRGLGEAKGLARVKVAAKPRDQSRMLAQHDPHLFFRPVRSDGVGNTRCIQPVQHGQNAGHQGHTIGKTGVKPAVEI